MALNWKRTSTQQNICQNKLFRQTVLVHVCMYDYGLNGSHNDGMFLANMSLQTCLSAYDESKNQERA